MRPKLPRVRRSIEALVGRAASLRETQRDTAALLAIEAYRLADTPATRSTLFGTFTDDERFLDAHHFAGERGTSGIVMPDGSSGYLTDQSGLLRPYDLESGALGDPLPAVGADDLFPVLAASSDGDRLAVASRSDPSAGPTTFGVIDTKTDALVFEPIVVDGPVTSIAFLPAGRLAVAIGENARLVVIDAATGVAVSEQAGLDMQDDTIIWTLDPQTRKSGRVLRRPSSVAVAGNELLLGAGDGTLRVLDGETFEVRRTVTLEKQTLSRLWPLEDGTVVTAGRFGVTRLDLTAGTTSVEGHRVRALHQSHGRRSTRCALLRRSVRPARGARPRDWGDPSDGSTPRTATVVRCGPPRAGPNSSASATTSRWCHAGVSTSPVRSRELVAPGWITIDFDHSGDRLLLERGNPLDDTYEAALLDVEDGSIAATIEDLVSPYWTGPDSLFGIGRSPDGSIEFATLDLDGRRARRRGSHARDRGGTERGDQRPPARQREGQDAPAVSRRQRQQLACEFRPDVATVRADDPRRRPRLVGDQPDG